MNAKSVLSLSKKFIIIPAIMFLLLASALIFSWLFLGYWWYPGSPCNIMPSQPDRGEVEQPWLLPFGTDTIYNQGKVCFFPQDGNLPANDLRRKFIRQAVIRPVAHKSMGGAGKWISIRPLYHPY
jgi:hypothetical protein